jgi:DNA-binding MarR family transcriptional regulator
MHPSPSSETGLRPDAPRTPEEAVIGLLMQAGRKLRTRHPEDLVEPSCFPLAKHLMVHDALRISDLAAKVELDTSTVSRQVKMLEDRGVVERAHDPADGRASLVRLSDAGRTILKAAMQRRFERIKHVLEPWTERDRLELQRLLTRLAADLRDANEHEESSR